MPNVFTNVVVRDHSQSFPVRLKKYAACVLSQCIAENLTESSCTRDNASPRIAHSSVLPEERSCAAVDPEATAALGNLVANKDSCGALFDCHPSARMASDVASSNHRAGTRTADDDPSSCSTLWSRSSTLDVTALYDGACASGDRECAAACPGQESEAAENTRHATGADDLEAVAPDHLDSRQGTDAAAFQDHTAAQAQSFGVVVRGEPDDHNLLCGLRDGIGDSRESIGRDQADFILAAIVHRRHGLTRQPATVTWGRLLVRRDGARRQTFATRGHLWQATPDCLCSEKGHKGACERDMGPTSADAP
mmetsp:Transcript_15238/g.41732  ORF Transcript_15238/g.41732 Transcript_15238/m.41732 type:complete len:308 (+) Transcript_15238:218-1141(+)